MFSLGMGYRKTKGWKGRDRVENRKDLGNVGERGYKTLNILHILHAKVAHITHNRIYLAIFFLKAHGKLSGQ